MENSNQILADAILKAAQIISNNGALGPNGESYGGLEAHSMKVGRAIDGLAAAMSELAEQMARIANVVENQQT